MKNARPMKQTIDARLSGLTVEPALRQAILDRMEGEHVVKRKLSMSIILALLMLLLLASVAFALSQFTQHAAQIALMEKEKGYFEKWGAEDRVALVKILVDSGEMASDEQTEKLLAGVLDEETASQIAAEIIAKWLGPHARVDLVTFASIMQKVWGSAETWTLEQKAWHSQLLMEMGMASDSWISLLPGKEDISQDKAVEIARQGIIDGYGITSEMLERHTIQVDFIATQQKPDEHLWLILFVASEGTAAERQAMWYEPVLVSGKTGQLVEMPEHGIFLPAEAARQLKETREKIKAWDSDPVMIAARVFESTLPEDIRPFFRNWPLEAKAGYTDAVRDIALEAIAKNPEIYAELDWIVAQTTYAYGLPQPGDIAEQDALDIAYATVIDTFGIDEELLKAYWVNTYYDITDPDAPRWRFFLNGHSAEAHDIRETQTIPDDQFAQSYRIEISPQTGDVLSVVEYNFEPEGLEHQLMML